MLHCTWMVCWIANNTRLFRANCFPTDRVISNWNRCSHIHWPIYLLHWNMDQKTEIRSYMKCCIRFNIQSTLVISNSKGLAEIPRDIRTSTYQGCRIEEKIIQTTTFNKYICNWTLDVRDILKILWKREEIVPLEQFLLISTIFLSCC